MKRYAATLIVILFHAAFIRADEPLTYSKHVKPFLTQYCHTCHNPMKLQGGLNVETVAGMFKGGVSGPSIIPGKPDESYLVTLSEGKHEPIMPPKSALKKPKPGEADVLRAWVAAGGIDDTNPNPIIPRQVPVRAAVTALAYTRDGKFLAVGGYGEVFIFDTSTYELAGKIPGQLGKVTALAYSRSGGYLAVASGEAGKVGQVRVYFVPNSGAPTGKPEFFFRPHKDLVHDLAFSLDGETLATSSYDRTVKLWDFPMKIDPKNPVVEPRYELKDHSDAVYGIAFSPDSKRLASVSADRAVKIWDVKTGKRLFTLGDATDGLYSVVWHPEGKHLAAAGIDKSIRVWELGADQGKVVDSTVAHEKAILRLAYSADGKSLYSLSEDRTAKAWDTGKLKEKKAYGKQPETVLTLGVNSKLGHIAIGRFDGEMVILDEATGKGIASPLPVKPKLPVITKISPSSATRGQVVAMVIEGRNLDDVIQVSLTGVPGIEWAYRERIPRTKSKIAINLLVPDETPAGQYPLVVHHSGGPSNPMALTVDRFKATLEAPPNNMIRTAQAVQWRSTLIGGIAKAGETDFYRFDAKAGMEIGVQLGPVLPLPTGLRQPVLEAFLALYDPNGKVVAESADGLLGHRCLKDGSYVLAIRDRDYRGDDTFGYHLHLGDIPIVTRVYPLGVRQGTEADIQLEGVNLDGCAKMRVSPAKNAIVGGKLPINVNTAYGPALGGKSVIVGEFAETETKSNTLVIPCTANGRLVGDTGDTWKFTAKKGERLIIEVNARRLGSPVDSLIEILDSKGKPVPRAVLRSMAKTAVAFRDHDSAGAGIRLDAWNELAINDYLYANGELIRIKSLPRNPDDDCQFFTAAGQRQCFLDTTAMHHAMGTAMHKVEIHPPGTNFPANGLPTFSLYYRNDDGGSGYGKDSRLFFDPPADGEYQIRIINQNPLPSDGDAPYRLTIRPPRPGFNISFNPTAPSVWKGGAVPIQITAERIDGYDGPIELRFAELPAGFSAPITMIPAGETFTSVALFAESDAIVPAGAPPLKLVGKAKIDGKEMVREALGKAPQVMEAGEIVTLTEQSEVTIKPGGEVRVTVKIERRLGFNGRVPIEVRGLPHGVHVLDIGLNGILITEKETTRTFVIRCEPWVEPTDHPFVVLAKREGKNTDHAAKSILLKVEKK